MSRRKFVMRNGELVEVDPSTYVPVTRNHDAVLWNDRAYQDAGDPRFSSRKAHREYMKANNLTTMDDFKQSWDQAKKQREEYFTSGKHGAIRREDIARAIHHLTRNR